MTHTTQRDDQPRETYEPPTLAEAGDFAEVTLGAMDGNVADGGPWPTSVAWG
ncbi:lasso RiPP family leader peptide-containing protein [Streptomyces sp. SBT349]|uniref:lasso RiPP family leader peptide-containing protein n=1 Tax=Streptomyces sp. SBT349 TaxID=1580539 RepID=UPI00131E0399|nr:lasso RiPP family leader peptide-containing protein [Streptomyces sp. SBT349]